MRIFITEELGGYYINLLTNLSINKEKESDIVVPDVMQHEKHYTLFLLKMMNLSLIKTWVLTSTYRKYGGKKTN